MNERKWTLLQSRTRSTMHKSEETHSLCRGKKHYTADLLFGRFGFDKTSKSDDYYNGRKLLDPNQSNRRSSIQLK